MQEHEIRKAVREQYGAIARQGSSCCGDQGLGSVGACLCGGGYSTAELQAAPEGAYLGLGCGNPLAIDALRPGETVLDLGSGGGFDCFLAAGKVGPQGRVIGVDMTPDMLERARNNAAKGGYTNVEFRLGEIEHLPVADNSVDVILSNCVINLAPDKGRVFREACRVLKPGGRLQVSDMVLLAPLPAAVLESAAAYVGCVAGALPKADYLAALQQAGLGEVRVLSETAYSLQDYLPAQARELAELIAAQQGLDQAGAEELLTRPVVASISVRAVKPQ